MTRITPRFAALTVLAALASAGCSNFGCGKTESTGAKETLSDQEKQQLQDLDQQRQDEWGKKKKK